MGHIYAFLFSFLNQTNTRSVHAEFSLALIARVVCEQNMLYYAQTHKNTHVYLIMVLNSQIYPLALFTILGDAISDTLYYCQNTKPICHVSLANSSEPNSANICIYISAVYEMHDM